jgi:trk system potassium uptake protein TrkA
MKQFVVIGLGNFGFTVATRLAQIGHQVLAADTNATRVEHIKDLVTQAVVIDAKDKNALTEVVTNAIDAAVVGLGDSVEASLLCVLYLKELGVRRIIAKAASDDHGRILESIGTSEVIYPERDAGLRLAEKLNAPTSVIDYIELSPDYSIIDVATPDDFVGKTLKQLQLPKKQGILVIAVRSVLKGNEIQLLPPADYKFEPDSVITVIGRYEDLNKLTL